LTIVTRLNLCWPSVASARTWLPFSNVVRMRASCSAVALKRTETQKSKSPFLKLPFPACARSGLDSIQKAAITGRSLAVSNRVKAWRMV